MERLFDDLRFAARVLRKDRGFTVTATLTLAVCIAANVVMFAVVHSVLLKPLPVPHAEQLVYMYNAYPGAGVEAGRGASGVTDYYDRLAQTDVFQEQALYNTTGVTLGGSGEPQRIRAMTATPSLLRLLQVRPFKGRFFDESDGELGNTRKAVLTFASWQAWFGGRDDALGQDVRIGGEPYTVIGVLPAEFAFLDPEVKLWLPVAFTAQQKSDDSRHSNNWSYLARLKPGATVEQARQQIEALNARNLDRFPDLKQILVNAGFHTVVVRFQDYLTRDMRSTLFLLWGGAAFVLLIGVVNVTNLMLVRSTSRTKELATRHALGAGFARLSRQLLTESVLVTAAASALGIALGYAAMASLSAFALNQTPQGTAVAIDPVVLGIAVAAAFAIGIAIGLLPVLGVRQTNLSRAFREDGRTGTATRGARAIRRVLVAAQIAFAFMLLIGAGLLLASFQRVLDVDPGFETDRVLTGLVSPPASRYRTDPDRRTFWNRLLASVRSLPGVEAAGATSNLPFGGNYSDSVILAEGYAMAPGESLISPYRVTVTPGYFEAMSIPLRSGRFFTESDDAAAPKVAIVDERLAKRFWGTKDPIGRRLWKPDSPQELSSGPGPKTTFFTVVGVVRSVRVTGLTEAEPVGMYYFPSGQSGTFGMTLVARAAGDFGALTTAIRRQLAVIDPELPFFGVRPMQERVDASLDSRRTPMLLAVVFGGVAVFLAAVGIYGVLAYQVTQRRKEIGIRLALGSNARGVFALVLREGLLLLGAGVVFGLGGAFAIRRGIETQLFGVHAMDPFVLAAVAAALGLVALVACSVPARRAARINPVVALSDQ
jgi:putative ABC transport system permease protein